MRSPTTPLYRLTLPLLLLQLTAAATITLQDPCRLYVGKRVFDLTQVPARADLPLTTNNDNNYTVLSSLCTPVAAADVQRRFPGRKLVIDPKRSGTPAVVVVKENSEKNEVEVFDLAVFSTEGNSKWKATIEDVKEKDSKELKSKNIPSLEISYKVDSTTSLSELKIKTILYRFVCFQDDEFDFFDERVVGSTLILQYDGKKACSINEEQLFDRKWNFAVVILAFTSIYGIFLDRDHERIVMTLGSVQGAFMTVIGVYIAIGYVTGSTNQEKDMWMQIFGISFVFLAVGLSYFSRYVSMFFVCIASSFAVNCTLLYSFCLIFRLYIPIYLFYIGGIICAASLLALLWFSTPFREKYSFTIVSATTNSFYLCASLAYVTNCVVNMFNFNQFKAFGKVDHVAAGNWGFLLLQLAITGGVVGFRMHQARKHREEATARNKSLFRKEERTGDVEGYFAPDRGDEDPHTVIAM